MTEEPAVQEVTIGEVAPTLIENMPEVNENVLNVNVDTSSSTPQTSTAQLVDTKGNSFNKEIHITDKEGQPVLTKTGKARLKSGLSQVNVQEVVDRKRGEGDRKVAAATATHLIEQMGVGLGGKDAKFKIQASTGIDERAYIFEAFDGYFDAKGVTDFPPMVGLVLGLSVYGMRVMSETPAKDKTKSFFYYMKSKFSRKNKGKSDATRTNTRDDRKREDTSSQESS
jgi:hypothetical protein